MTQPCNKMRYYLYSHAHSYLYYLALSRISNMWWMKYLVIKGYLKHRNRFTLVFKNHLILYLDKNFSHRHDRYSQFQNFHLKKFDQNLKKLLDWGPTFRCWKPCSVDIFCDENLSLKVIFQVFLSVFLLLNLIYVLHNMPSVKYEDVLITVLYPSVLISYTIRNGRQNHTQRV